MQNSNIRAVVPSTVIAIIELHRIDDANLLLLPGRVTPYPFCGRRPRLTLVKLRDILNGLTPEAPPQPIAPRAEPLQNPLNRWAMQPRKKRS